MDCRQVPSRITGATTPVPSGRESLGVRYAHTRAIFYQPIESNSSAAHKMENEHDHSDDQNDVDESTRDVKGKAANPKQHEANGNDEKHDSRF